MSKYILLVETGSDLPADLKKQYSIYTVPMHVAFGDETRDDGTFPIEDIYHFFESTGKLTKTSGSTPEDFTRVFDEIFAEHPDCHILHLAYSAVTTCSYQSAIIAAEERNGITSIDTKHVSAGQTMVAVLMARWLEAHPDASIDEVSAQVDIFSRACRMGFFPGDLAYLKAGGRVSNAAYMGAKILSLHPLIELLDGYLKATKKYRGKRDKILPKFMREYVEENHLNRDVLYFVYAEGLEQSIHDECDAIAREMGFKEIRWIRTGGVITTHCGPGGFGVCGISEDC